VIRSRRELRPKAEFAVEAPGEKEAVEEATEYESSQLEMAEMAKQAKAARKARKAAYTPRKLDMFEAQMKAKDARKWKS
jgi:hypothetical protein